jgi:SpoVK/Ycf46/Vps4 family AAA+-type ATPase
MTTNDDRDFARASLELGFARIRLRVERLLLRTASRLVDSAGQLSDRFVARAEVVEFLRGGTTRPAELDRVEQAIADADRQLLEQTEAALIDGRVLPLAELAFSFGLDDLGQLVVLALLAAELDQGFARAYAHAWSDFTRKHADVAFLSELLDDAPGDAERVRDLLQPDGPLAASCVIVVTPPAGLGPEPPLSQHRVRLPGRVVDYLRGELAPSPHRWGRAARVSQPVTGLAGVLLPDPVKAAYMKVQRELRPRPGKPAFLLLCGPDGSGRQSLAEAAAAERRERVVLLDNRHAPAAADEYGAMLREVVREARLQQGPLVIRLEELEGEGPRALGAARLQQLGEVLDRAECVVIGLCEREPDWWLHRYPATAVMQVPFPTTEVQAALWERFLPPDVPLAAGLGVADIVKRYALPGGAIQRAALELRGHAAALPAEERRLTSDSVYRSVRRQLSHRLGELAEPVAIAYDWSDLILPEQTTELLRELISYYRNRNRILTDWGFGGKLVYGRGLAALLSGPPGTGKTMSASVIARELGKEMFRVDVSRIVDKYIGETEKNLGRVFDEAVRAQAVLLFDEADSLFAKRTEVKSSIDRYANLEVNYLLQKIESYEGITLLTTNLESSIDEAFKRRIRYRITFPFPQPEERTALWRSMMPAEAAVASDVDYEDLAYTFEMAGGNIKNAIIRAAIFAANEGSSIAQEHLVRAARSEYQEMGKLVRS